MRRSVGLTFVLLIAVAICGGPARAEQPQTPRPVRTETATLTRPTETFTYSGTVQARRQAELGFRVGGKIMARAVDPGARVRARDVLAQLDTADLRLSLESATSAVLAAEAEATNLRAELRRYAALGQGSPAYIASEYDKRAAQQAMADARLTQARRQSALAQSQLAYGTLTADADGVVTAVMAEVGQVIQAGQTVVSLAHTAATEVVVDVPENRLAAVRAAPSVSVALWSQPDQHLEGHVREIGARADSASRTFAVRVALPPGTEAPLGATATVQWQAAAAAVVVLPAAALVQRDGHAAVWVLDPARQRATPRPVTVAGYRNDQVVLMDGLVGGEQVVTAGATQLDAEMPVTAWAGPTR